jgi:hypothetical protein
MCCLVWGHLLCLCYLGVVPIQWLPWWDRSTFQPNSFPYIYRLLPSPVIIHNHLPVMMEPTEGFETSAFKIQTPGKYSVEYLPHLQHGESLKTKKCRVCYGSFFCCFWSIFVATRSWVIHVLCNQIAPVDIWQHTVIRVPLAERIPFRYQFECHNCHFRISSSPPPPLGCTVYLKQTMYIGYILLQLFCSYSSRHMCSYAMKAIMRFTSALSAVCVCSAQCGCFL